ncbi:hydrogenase subunit MbhD domain-containing protein [Thioalkalicoccus limnaeus]|uniref:Hydrogenase subunit MbhD domain-containing protein n=1 Tax=Thioalkalicoccus limnaeus TaxID=120681 RepID=A0ABV4BMB8_9GAMM
MNQGLTLALAVDLGLTLAALGLAAWVIGTGRSEAAIVGFVAYGLLLALVWVRLAAPDVALTEAAIGSGLTGLLLLGAARRLRGTEAAFDVPPERPPRAQHWLAALFSALVALALAGVVLTLPEPAPSLAPEAVANLPQTGLGNAVTGVLLAYRALDTLLETLVLLLALVAVWSLAPDRAWGGRPRLWHPERGGALTLLAQLLPPFGIVVGLYLFWNGANAPGGAFQGGTILAAMWLLVMLAGLARAPTIDARWLRWLVIAGPAVFLGIALLGFAIAGAFLGYPPALAKPLILIIETALTLSIAATLALLIAGPPQPGPPS